MELIVYKFLPILLVTTIVSREIVVQKQYTVKYGGGITIPCKIDGEQATQCEWAHNQFVKLTDPKSNYVLSGNSTLGDCSITIKKFIIADEGEWMCIFHTIDRITHATIVHYLDRITVQVSHNLPSKPQLVINSYPEVASGLKIVFDPAKPDVTLKCISQNAYPLFKENGSVSIYVDNVLQSETGVLTDSIKYPGTNVNTVEIKLKLEEDSDVKCVVKHESLEKPYESIITMLHPNSKFKLSKSAVKLIDPKDKQKLDMPRYFGRTSSLDLKWLHKLENETNWNEIVENKKESFYTATALQQPGTYRIKLELKQKNYFNVLIESQDTVILTYVPMTEVKILPPFNLALTIGQKETLECQADGYPAPEFFWIKVTSDSIDVVGNGSIHTVGNRLADEGYYKCDAIQKLFQQEVLISSYKAVKVSFH